MVFQIIWVSQQCGGNYFCIFGIYVKDYNFECCFKRELIFFEDCRFLMIGGIVQRKCEDGVINLFVSLVKYGFIDELELRNVNIYLLKKFEF